VKNVTVSILVGYFFCNYASENLCEIYSWKIANPQTNCEFWQVDAPHLSHNMCQNWSPDLSTLQIVETPSIAHEFYSKLLWGCVWVNTHLAIAQWLH